METGSVSRNPRIQLPPRVAKPPHTHQPQLVCPNVINCPHNRIYPRTTKLKHFRVGNCFKIAFFTSGVFQVKQLALLLSRSDTLKMKNCKAVSKSSSMPFCHLWGIHGPQSNSPKQEWLQWKSFSQILRGKARLLIRQIRFGPRREKHMGEAVTIEILSSAPSRQRHHVLLTLLIDTLPLTAQNAKFQTHFLSVKVNHCLLYFLVFLHSCHCGICV